MLPPRSEKQAHVLLWRVPAFSMIQRGSDGLRLAAGEVRDLFFYPLSALTERAERNIAVQPAEVRAAPRIQCTAIRAFDVP